jgi:hypothetical protein
MWRPTSPSTICGADRPSGLVKWIRASGAVEAPLAVGPPKHPRVPIYTATEIYAFLRQAGFQPDQATTLTAIALAESGGNSSSHNTGGEDSRGHTTHSLMLALPTRCREVVPTSHLGPSPMAVAGDTNVSVTYSSGATGVQGLDPKTADAAGGVSSSVDRELQR